MKVIGRILIILAAAAVVAGLAVVLVNNGILNLDAGQGRRGELPTGLSHPGGEPGERGEFDGGRERGGDHHAAGFGIGTLVETGKNLGAIALIIAGVTLIGFGSSRIFRQPPAMTKEEKYARLPAESGDGGG
jgi:hypothetical protein